MISLVSVRVFKYKSIEDSTKVDVASDVTVLVGKNESGKTAFLEALHKALPLGTAKFDFVFDYPRKDYVRYRPQHEAKEYAKAVELTFRPSRSLLDRINREVFHGAQVLPGDFTFSRTTTYGNTNTIGIAVDHKAAIAAFRKQLGSVADADEVFEAAKLLEDILKKIDEKQLAPDSTLGAFAKLWRDRHAKASAGWDYVGWHLWNDYLNVALPRFLYFDDYSILEGKLNLEGLNQRVQNGQTSESDETALGLFELAGTNLKELMSEEGYENSKAKLEAIGLTITSQVFEFWKQNRELAVEFDVKADPTDKPSFNTGKNLYIRVKNLRHGVTVPFSQRSKGFIWFFSFMVWFSAVENRAETDKQLILLLDEPGLNLHALAQADFLIYINALSKSRQIIYTTHSPFMVESEALGRVRVVEDRAKEGTKVSGDLQGSSDESLFPLQAALGYSVAQNLFISKKNILVEGPADYVLLQHMSSVLERTGGTFLTDGVFVPVGGLDKLATFVALLGANKLQLVVLHDRASGPAQGLENLVHRKLIERKRVLDYSSFRTLENVETDLEDLFPESLYIEAFNESYARELAGSKLTVSALSQHPRIVERINRWLTTNGITLLKIGGFNHYRVSQALVPKLTAEAVGADCLERFGRMFSELNGLLK